MESLSDLPVGSRHSSPPPGPGGAAEPAQGEEEEGPKTLQSFMGSLHPSFATMQGPQHPQAGPPHTAASGKVSPAQEGHFTTLRALVPGRAASTKR